MKHFETEKKTRMELIIPIFKSVIGKAKEEVNSVSARELWEGLESKRDFSAWVKAKVVENKFFIEGEDWILLPNIGERAPTRAAAAGSNKKEYALTLKAAKKVAMSEQTAKGNEVREYFIKKEEEANAKSPIHPLLQEELNLRSFRAGLEIAKLAGKEGDDAVSAANFATIYYQGEDILRIMQIADIVTKKDAVYYNVRDLCGKIGITAQEFNRLLEAEGLLVKIRSNPLRDAGYYLPTERGKIYSNVYDAGYRDTTTGEPRISIKWCMDVLSLVNKAYIAENVKPPRPIIKKRSLMPTKRFTPTEMGKMVGLSARRVNRALEWSGFQEATRSRNGTHLWSPTTLGEPHCLSIAVTKGVRGNPLYRLFWTKEAIYLCLSGIQLERRRAARHNYVGRPTIKGVA